MKQFDIKKSILFQLIKKGLFQNFEKEANRIILNIDYVNLLSKCIQENSQPINNYFDGYDIQKIKIKRYSESGNPLLFTHMLNLSGRGVSAIIISKEDFKEIYILNCVVSACSVKYNFCVQTNCENKYEQQTNAYMINEKLEVTQRKTIIERKKCTLINETRFTNNIEVGINNYIIYKDKNLNEIINFQFTHGSYLSTNGEKIYIFWKEKELK